MYALLRWFPGYTAATLLAEDAETVTALELFMGAEIASRNERGRNDG